MKQPGSLSLRTGLGIYVHWPYCESKCPYCDFNSHVATAVDQSRWARAYVQELRRAHELTADSMVHTVFFGGGTPSLMEAPLVLAILDEIRKLWRVTNDIEITLEANPGSVERTRFEGYRLAGVNRVSLGVQALDPQALFRLGRRHSVEDAIAAITLARTTFDRVSIDLIYARQDQQLPDWQAELDRAMDLGTDHISLYQLTIEDGTIFARLFEQGRLAGLPDEDLGADMYLQTLNRCAARGLYDYEVSNFSRPGSESRHNLNYWRGGAYIGIGPGAHGRLNTAQGRLATEAIRDPRQWLDAVETRGNGELAATYLSSPEVLDEFLLMGLRLREGVDLQRLTDLGFTPRQRARCDELADLGLLVAEDGRIRTTRRGQMLLNSVLAHLSSTD